MTDLTSICERSIEVIPNEFYILEEEVREFEGIEFKNGSIIIKLNLKYKFKETNSFEYLEKMYEKVKKENPGIII